MSTALAAVAPAASKKLGAADQSENAHRAPSVAIAAPAPDDKRRRTPDSAVSPSIEFWCRVLITKIFDGNLQGLNRVASTIAHLEPSKHASPGPWETASLPLQSLFFHLSIVSNHLQLSLPF